MCIAAVASSPTTFRRAEDIPIVSTVEDEKPFRARPRFIRYMDAHKVFSNSVKGLRKIGLFEKELMAEYAAGLLQLGAAKKAELDELNRETFENMGNTYVKVSDLSEVDARFKGYFESFQALYKELLERVTKSA
jgi:hypothetical protein